MKHTPNQSCFAKYAGPQVLQWARPGYVDGGIIVKKKQFNVTELWEL